MRPTALGVKAALFYVALLGAFFAAPYANLFFLLLAFLAILALTSYVSGRRNLAGVRATIDELDPVPAATPAPVAVTLHGGKRMRLALGVRIELEGRAPVVLSGVVVSGESRVAGRVPPLPRGVYPVRRASVFTTWPLGLYRFFQPVPAPTELVVYPAPAQLTGEGNTGIGDLYNALGGEGFLQPSALREYQPGDELRLVAWKASARRGSFVIKEWEGGSGAGHEAVLDRRTDPESLEQALSLLSALALAAKEQKDLLTLHSQDLSATFGRQRRPWRELLTFLAQAKALPDDAPPPPAASPSVLRLPWNPGGAA